MRYSKNTELNLIGLVNGKTKVNAQTSNEGELCDNCYYEKSNGVKGLGKAISAIKLALDNK